MRILSILPFPLFPLSHGGRVRAYRLAAGLVRAGGTVDLCCPWGPGLPLGPFERDGVTIRPYVFAGNLLPALLGDRFVPPLVQLSWQPFTLGPRRLLRQCRDYDIVEFHFCAFASWMSRAARDTRVVYSAHNVELDYALGESRSKLYQLFARRIGELERQAVRSSDLVVTCTHADGDRLSQLYGTMKRSAVISNGFDEEELPRVAHADRWDARATFGLQSEELAILFVGGRAPHNRRAVRFLEEQVLPRLARPARLILAGECAPPRRNGRVIALGFVESLSPLLAAADVAVNPVASGSGSNVKLIEYVAAGLPVVTTPIGLRGYERFGPLLTVVELDHFAAALQVVRRDEHQRAAVAELGWGALGRRLYDTYAELIAERALSRAGRGPASHPT